MKYNHLSIEEREKIQEMLWRKASVRNIARALNRSPSSISREIRRNRPLKHNRYTPRLAHKRALQYRSHRGKRKLDANTPLKQYVVSHMKLGWSPEQVAQTAQNTVGVSISHEAIYQYVYAQVYRGGHGYARPGREDLRQYLPRRRKRRVRKGKRRTYRVQKGPLPCIDRRPKEVETRSVIGHWEDDSIIYTPTSSVRLRTMNELRSGVVFIEKTCDRTMAEAHRVSYERLGQLPPHTLKTLTRDRGAENLGYAELEEVLGLRCYFAHAYCSWERGANENVNGLIRRFFPRGTDFDDIPDEEIRRVEYLLNTRPRKRLDWKTPYEVFYELTGVAL